MKVKVGAEQRKTFCFSLLDSINRAGGTENRGREGRKVDKKYISPVSSASSSWQESDIFIGAGWV